MTEFHKICRLSAGTSEEDSGTFDHKRHRQVHTQSSASSSYGSVATSGTDVLSCDTIAERPSSVLLSAALKQSVFKEQGRATGVLRLAEVVDTSCWSTDGGHDEISGGNTSTFTSSEEEDSQLHQPLGSFLNVKHKGPASIGPNGRARTHMWSDTGGLLSLRLDTFIEKEKDKIESSDTAGSGAQSLSKSEWSLSGSLHGVESSGSQERPFVDRSTGSGADIGGSCSMEDGSSFLARRCTQARSQGRSRLEIVESDPVNSMLLSYLSKQQLSALEFCRTEESVMSGMESRGKEERKRTLAVRKLCPVSIGLQGPIYGLPGVQLSSTENMRMQDEDGIRSSDTRQTFVLSSGRPSSTEGIRSYDTHQTFVLSSGRPSSTEGIRSSDNHQTFVLSSGRPSSTEGIFMICMLLLNTFAQLFLMVLLLVKLAEKDGVNPLLFPIMGLLKCEHH
jgi:hypothetical protein